MTCGSVCWHLSLHEVGNRSESAEFVAPRKMISKQVEGFLTHSDFQIVEWVVSVFCAVKNNLNEGEDYFSFSFTKRVRERDRVGGRKGRKYSLCFVFITRMNLNSAVAKHEKKYFVMKVKNHVCCKKIFIPSLLINWLHFVHSKNYQTFDTN